MDDRDARPEPAALETDDFDWAARLDADAPDVTLMLDEELRVVWRSGSAEGLTGYSDSEVAGTTRFDTVDAADLGTLMASMEIARATPGVPTPVEFGVLTGLGRLRAHGWLSDIGHLRAGHTFARLRIVSSDEPGPAGGTAGPATPGPLSETAAAANVGLAAVVPNGDLVYRNERMLEWFRKPGIDELTELPAAVAPVDRVAVAAWCTGVLELLRGHGTTALPASITAELNGETKRFIRLTMSTHRTGIGPFAGITAQDVTDIVAARNSLRQVVDLLPQMVFAIDLDGTVQFANRATARWLGLDVGSLDERFDSAALPALLGEQATAELLASARELVDRGRPVRNHTDTVIAHDGSERILRSSFIPFTQLEDGRPTLLAVCSDVTEELRNEELLFALGRNMPDLALVLDSVHHVTFASDSVEELLGWTPAEFSDQVYEDLVHADDLDRAHVAHDPSASAPGSMHTVELRLLHRDGTWHWFEMRAINLSHLDSIGGMLLFGRDISERKEHERRLHHEATHDRLTGLLNRATVLDRLELALGRARTSGTPAGALFVDVDNFKLVNDGLGHEEGDRVLRTVGMALVEGARSDDAVGRLGGDEFLVVAQGVSSEAELRAIADRARQHVRFATMGNHLPITLSIGACLCADGRTPGQTMVRTADAAMYRAKENGKDRTEVFHPDHGGIAVRRLDVGRMLAGALANDHLVPHYQPVFALQHGRWCLRAVEALARCPIGNGEYLSPEEFVPVAEQTGMIAAMGHRMASLVAEQLGRWHRRGWPVTGWINLSVAELGQPDLPGELEGLLAEAGLPTSALGVEITESVLAAPRHQATAVLRELRARGIRVLIDDFGTGYSSLAALKRYPVDVAKIDREFIAGLGASAVDDAVIESVTRIGRVMGFDVVAEGVERPSQLDRLVELGCTTAQGWLLSHALPADEVTRLLPSWMEGLELPISASLNSGAGSPAPK